MLMGHFISFLIWITMVFGQVESFQEAIEFGSDCNCMAEINNTKQEVEKEIEDLKQQNNNLQDQFNTLQEQLAKLLESNKGYEACFEDLGSANCTGSQSGKVGIVEAIRVDGEWGPFSEWSQCSVTCGGGVQFRNRTCNNPSPHNGGKPCSGDGVQQEGCNADKCYGSLKLDANGVPYLLIGSKWMPICGHYFWDNNIGADIVCQNLGYYQGGVLQHVRGVYREDAYYVGRCDSKSITDLENGCTKEVLAAQYSCKKSPVSIHVKCTQYSCKKGSPVSIIVKCRGSTVSNVDGGWSGFGSCSATCGGGIRTRTCTNPPPSGNGAPCSGDNDEHCNTNDCSGTKEDIGFQVDKQDRMVVLMVGGYDRNKDASVEIVTEHGGCSNHDIPPLPEGRRGGAVGVVLHTQESENGTLEQVEVLMFCGGSFRLREKADCWTLDFSLMEWSTAPSLLHATAYPAYTSVKERFYVVGGLGGRYGYGNTALDHLQIYSEGKWQLGKPLPSKRYGACCKAYLNYLVVTGGWSSPGWPRDPNMVTQKEIFVYSERSRKWKKLTTPDSYIGRAQHSCATITYKNTSAIALVGGKSYQRLNRTKTRPWRIDMLLLNKTGISWDHEDIEPVLGSYPTVGVAPGGELVAAGLRYTGWGGYSGEVMRWSPGRTSWEHLGNLTTPRDKAAVLNLDLKWAWLAKRCRINL